MYHIKTPSMGDQLAPEGGRTTVDKEIGRSGLSLGKELPAVIATSGADARKRFTTYFTDNIRNKNTRQAYFRAVCSFFNWCESLRLSLCQIDSYHVSAYVEVMMQEKSKPTVKQHLAAIRMFYDWLIVGQVVRNNPAHAVRGPKHVVTEGLTPILDAEQMKQLLNSIDHKCIVGLRDRALIAVMTATFGRIESALSMDTSDYFDDGKNWCVKLREKNGKTILMPVQHKLEEYLDAYIEVAGFSEVSHYGPTREDRAPNRQPLFRSARGRSGKLTDSRMRRQDAWRMIKRRAKRAGLSQRLNNHSFRGTGITNYLENGGSLSEAQRMAGHSDPRTTRLYDRRSQKITRGEVERITILV